MRYRNININTNYKYIYIYMYVYVCHWCFALSAACIWRLLGWNVWGSNGLWFICFLYFLKRFFSGAVSLLFKCNPTSLTLRQLSGFQALATLDFFWDSSVRVLPVVAGIPQHHTFDLFDIYVLRWQQLNEIQLPWLCDNFQGFRPWQPLILFETVVCACCPWWLGYHSTIPLICLIFMFCVGSS